MPEDKSKKKGFLLMPRDIAILKAVSKYKFCLGRQIRLIGGFSGEAACDRRLKKLIDYGFLERKRVLYGLPGIYFLGSKSRNIPEVKYYKYSLNAGELNHDLSVVDTMLYFCYNHGLSSDDFISESQLHAIDGFSRRKHRPDLVFLKDGKKYCIEVEFSEKGKDRFNKIINDNFRAYDGQYWIVPREEYKIIGLIEQAKLPKVSIIPWEVVKDDIDKRKFRRAK